MLSQPFQSKIEQFMQTRSPIRSGKCFGSLHRVCYKNSWGETKRDLSTTSQVYLLPSKEARVPKTVDHKPLRSTSITPGSSRWNSALLWPPQTACSSGAAPSSVSVPRKVSRHWNPLWEKVLETPFCVCASFGRKLCKSCSLGILHLPPLYFLTLFESRDCAISFYPAIILISSFPVPPRDAMCNTCVLSVAVEMC